MVPVPLDLPVGNPSATLAVSRGGTIAYSPGDRRIVVLRGGRRVVDLVAAQRPDSDFEGVEIHVVTDDGRVGGAIGGFFPWSMSGLTDSFPFVVEKGRFRRVPQAGGSGRVTGFLPNGGFVGGGAYRGFTVRGGAFRV